VNPVIGSHHRAGQWGREKIHRHKNKRAKITARKPKKTFPQGLSVPLRATSSHSITIAETRIAACIFVHPDGAATIVRGQIQGLCTTVGEIAPLQCAGINRHEVEDERALRVRSSDPLGLESCAATVRDPAKRRQRIGGLGIQLRKDAIWTPTPL
jgi:hypothetical protein